MADTPTSNTPIPAKTYPITIRTDAGETKAAAEITFRADLTYEDLVAVAGAVLQLGSQVVQERPTLTLVRASLPKVAG